MRRPMAVILAVLTPRYGTDTFPVWINCWMIGLAVSIEIEKPIPCASVVPRVLIPTTSPFMIDERSTGVTGIDRRVGLDQVEEGRARPSPASRPVPGHHAQWR